MKQCDLTKGLVVFLTIMITLFCGVMPSSWADGTPSCDQNDFQGFFAFAESGTVQMVMSKKTSLLPIASIGSLDMHWDENSDNQYGAGIITGTETINLGGVFFNASIEGEFVMSSNCTGTATIAVIPTYPESVPFPPVETVFSFVFSGNGKQSEIRTLITQMIPITPEEVELVFVPLAITGIAKPQG